MCTYILSISLLILRCIIDEQVYKGNPENVFALSSLARLATDMGLKEAEMYREELGRLERMQETRNLSNSSSSSSRSAPTRFGPPSRMGSSRGGQRSSAFQPQQHHSKDSFDDQNSDYGAGGYPSADPTTRYF